MLNDDDSGFVRVHLMQQISEKWRPFYMLAEHVKISIDGNQWCVLFGENLQDGVAGFGDSPDAASRAFDAAWFEKLPQEPPHA